jgi:outer membrane protein OmpA-like peptidoglycan-associated protein
MINSPQDEVAPFYQNSSHTLVFSSNGHSGMGGYDLFAAKGDITNWQMPENLGNPVNSSRDDIYFFAPENTPLLKNALLSSDRGSGCCLETYNLSKEEKDKILAGILYDCNTHIPLEGADIMLKDISGKTWMTTTNTTGEYQFSLKKESYSDLTLSVSKTEYQDTLVSFITENKDESDLLTDKLMNKRICIEKIEIPEPPVLVIKAENVVTVYFDFDRSQLKPSGIQKLDSIYQVLTDNKDITVQISGYTDGLGSEAYNKILSDKRAKQCADYLIKKGIDSTRITFVSFGACCPVEMEIINGRDNPDGRSLNRRALINLKKD